MASSIPVPPTSGAVGRPSAADVRERAPGRRTDAVPPPRWLVALGLVAYCGLIWALVAAGGIAGVQFVARALP